MGIVFMIIFIFGAFIYGMVYLGKYTTEKQETDFIENRASKNAILSMNGINGQIYVYDNKVVIERKGFNSVTTVGMAGSKTIPMSSIKSVQLKEAGAWAGFIEIGVLGGNERNGGLSYAAYNENTITIQKQHNETAKQIKDYIENIIIQREQITNNNSATVSSAEEIKKYKELFDDGIITQEEFDAKKKQLLGL